MNESVNGIDVAVVSINGHVLSILLGINLISCLDFNQTILQFRLIILITLRLISTRGFASCIKEITRTHLTI